MRLAGRYLNVAQQLNDAAVLSPLRHRQLNRATNQLTYSNIQSLASQARNELQNQMREGFISRKPITPKMLYETADNIINQVETLQDEMTGIQI
tara:strand:- start:240 stop:521 length:282 start_codon:yes stop_codon:yes gene_type:complete